MHRSLDELFRDQAQGKDVPIKPLGDWGLYNDFDFIVEAYQWWVNSGYIVLPEPGTIYDQSWHVKADFLLLAKLEKWHKQNEKKRKEQGNSNPLKGVKTIDTL